MSLYYSFLFGWTFLTDWAQLAVAKPKGVKISTSHRDSAPVAPEILSKIKFEKGERDSLARLGKAANGFVR
jgi:hypothetical protein